MKRALAVAAALCVTGLATLPSSGASQRADFKGIRVGDLMPAVQKEVQGAGLELRKASTTGGDSWDAAYTLVPSSKRLTIAEKPVSKAYLLFIKTKSGQLRLDSIFLYAKHDYADEILSALKNKFGQPSESFPTEYKNGFGMSFPDVLTSWYSLTDSSVSLDSFYDRNLTQCELHFMLSPKLSDRAAHKNQSLKDL